MNDKIHPTSFRLEKTLTGHSGGVAAVCYLGNDLGNDLLASGSHDGTIRIWNIQTGELKNEEVFSGMSIIDISTYTNDTFLATSRDNDTGYSGLSGALYVCDRKTGEQIEKFNPFGYYNRVASNGHDIACGSSTKEEFFILLEDKYIISIKASGFSCICYINADLLASGTEWGEIHIWNAKTGDLIKTLERSTQPMLVKRHDPIMDICSLENNLLASACAYGMINIWDITTDELKLTLKGHTDSVNCVCSLGNNLLASGSYDKTIKIWNTLTGECIQTLKGHTDFIWSICSLGKNMFASGSRDKTIKIWKRHAPLQRSIGARHLVGKSPPEYEDPFPTNIGYASRRGRRRSTRHRSNRRRSTRRRY